MKDLKEIDWNKLAREVHANSIEKGWWGENEQPLGTYLMLINCEICEAVEADRGDCWITSYDLGDYARLTETVGLQPAFETCFKGRVEEELADVVIRALDLAGAKNINIANMDVLYRINTISRPKSFMELAIFAASLTMNPMSEFPCPDLGFRYKIANLIAEILVYCTENNKDIIFVIEEKMKYNKLRPYMHGGKKY